MSKRACYRPIWTVLLLASVVTVAFIVDRRAKRRPTSNSSSLGTIRREKLPAIVELQELLDTDGASMEQKILACDQLEAWGTRAESAAPDLVKQLRQRGTLARHAMKALLANDHDVVVRELLDQMNSPDRLSRAVAAGALVHIYDRADVIVSRAIDLLNSKDPQKCEFACGILEGIGPAARRAVPSLLAELHGVNASTSNAAMTALHAIEPQVNPLVFADIRNLYHFFPVSKSVMRDLTTMRSDTSLALGDLVALCDADDPEVRASVEVALSHLDRPAPECIPMLIELARGNAPIGRTPSVAVQVLAVSDLGKADPSDPVVIPALLGFLQYPDIGDGCAQ